jgi:hypothetical protein
MSSRFFITLSKISNGKKVRIVETPSVAEGLSKNLETLKE